jgi:nitroreductase/NAD-dependent dihydropyrimidine dehydrogenase PreA subunit
MDIIQVNRETCLKDGICAATCPGGLIEFHPDDYPRSTELTEKSCIKCGHCVAVCPTGSLSHRDIPVGKCPPIQKSLQITPAQCENQLKSRRSLRIIKDQPVPRETITRVIDIARYAPSGHNWQEVEWLVIDDKKKLQQLTEIGRSWLRWVIANHPKSAEALELQRVLKRCESGINEFLRDVPVLVFAHADKAVPTAVEDCTSALTYFDLAANSLGLVCCWAGFVKISALTYPPMGEALAIPEGHVFGGMMVGYPKYKYHRWPLRQSPRITWR